MEVLHEPPNSSSFTPLIEHQSTTPASFYTSPPVLHYHSDRSKLIVLEHEARSVPALAPLLEGATQPATDTETNGTTPQGKPKTIPDINVYVTSEKLLLFSSTSNRGLSIPYPSISLHAIQSLPQPTTSEQQGLYMQIIASAAGEMDDEELESISLTVIPTAPAPPQIALDTTEGAGLEGEENPAAEATPVLAMFNALSTCSNLHPDPVDPGDEEGEEQGSRLFRAGLAFPGASDGGLPPAMPGSGGWITAENMHEFFDAEGNWIGRDEEGDDDNMDEGDDGPLGPGAGTVRQREDDGEHDGNGAAAATEDDTKWRRTG